MWNRKCKFPQFHSSLSHRFLCFSTAKICTSRLCIRSTWFACISITMCICWPYQKNGDSFAISILTSFIGIGFQAWGHDILTREDACASGCIKVRATIARSRRSNGSLQDNRRKVQICIHDPSPPSASQDLLENLAMMACDNPISTRGASQSVDGIRERVRGVSWIK